MRLVAGFDFVNGTGHSREQGGNGLFIAVGEVSGETFHAGRTSRGEIGYWFPDPNGTGLSVLSEALDHGNQANPLNVLIKSAERLPLPSGRGA